MGSCSPEPYTPLYAQYLTPPRSPRSALVVRLRLPSHIPAALTAGAGHVLGPEGLEAARAWTGYSRTVAWAFVGSFLSLVMYLAFVLVKLIGRSRSGSNL